jgi:hypothetical protein
MQNAKLKAVVSGILHFAFCILHLHHDRAFSTAITTTSAIFRRIRAERDFEYYL